MAHPAETGDCVVQWTYHGPGARRHRFLVDARDQPPAHLTALISLQRRLLKPADRTITRRRSIFPSFVHERFIG